VLGEPAYDELADVEADVDLVNVFRPSEEILEILGAVRERHAERGDAGAAWIQLGISHDEAAADAESDGIEVVSGPLYEGRTQAATRVVGLGYPASRPLPLLASPAGPTLPFPLLEGPVHAQRYPPEESGNAVATVSYGASISPSRIARATRLAAIAFAAAEEATSCPSSAASRPISSWTSRSGTAWMSSTRAGSNSSLVSMSWVPIPPSCTPRGRPPRRGTAVRGAGGLHGDDVGIGVALAEVASHPHQRPAGAAAGDHGAHLPVERLVDPGAVVLVVGLGVERVRELLGTTASSSSSAIRGHGRWRTPFRPRSGC